MDSGGDTSGVPLEDLGNEMEGGYHPTPKKSARRGGAAGRGKQTSNLSSLFASVSSSSVGGDDEEGVRVEGLMVHQNGSSSTGTRSKLIDRSGSDDGLDALVHNIWIILQFYTGDEGEKDRLVDRSNNICYCAKDTPISKGKRTRGMYAERVHTCYNDRPGLGGREKFHCDLSSALLERAGRD